MDTTNFQESQPRTQTPYHWREQMVGWAQVGFIQFCFWARELICVHSRSPHPIRGWQRVGEASCTGNRQAGWACLCRGQRQSAKPGMKTLKAQRRKVSGFCSQSTGYNSRVVWEGVSITPMYPLEPSGLGCGWKSEEIAHDWV